MTQPPQGWPGSRSRASGSRTRWQQPQAGWQQPAGTCAAAVGAAVGRAALGEPAAADRAEPQVGRAGQADRGSRRRRGRRRRWRRDLPGRLRQERRRRRVAQGRRPDDRRRPEQLGSDRRAGRPGARRARRPRQPRDRRHQRPQAPACAAAGRDPEQRLRRAVQGTGPDVREQPDHRERPRADRPADRRHHHDRLGPGEGAVHRRLPQGRVPERHACRGKQAADRQHRRPGEDGRSRSGWRRRRSAGAGTRAWRTPSPTTPPTPPVRPGHRPTRIPAVGAGSPRLR